MELKLKIMDGAQAGRELKITKSKFMIGRAEDCHLKPHSDQISRYHCCILNEDGFITVRDLGSKNGTIVNDERISGEVELTNGDILVVGPLKFQVSLVVEVKGEKKPKVNSIAEAAARTAETPATGGSQDDFDVAQWLGNQTALDGDTAIIDMKTTTVNLPPKYVPPPVEEQPAEDGSGSTSGSAVMNKDGSKMPVKPPAKNSREGAANAIRNIIRGR